MKKIDLIRAGFVIIQAYRLWVKAHRLWAEAHRLCGFSSSTYGTLREITDELG